MGIFDFFKKEDSPNVKDLIWMNHSSKLKGSLKILAAHPGAKLVAWFIQTEEEFREFYKQQDIKMPEIILAKNTPINFQSPPLIFLEHYPIRSKEETLMERLKAKEVIVLNSLDEPLFNQFGGEKIIDLMRKLGLAEEEHLEHAFISKSIVNAQQKLEKKVAAEILANSAEEWFKKNVSK